MLEIFILAIKQIKNDFWVFGIVVLVSIGIFPDEKFEMMGVAFLFTLVHFLTTVVKSKGKESPKNWKTFLDHIENSKWISIKESSNDFEALYTCSIDSAYQIEVAKYKGEKFRYPWSSFFSDKDCYLRSVSLKVNGFQIDRTEFVSCDGGRAFVPLPRFSEGVYVWHKESLGFKLAKIISSELFYYPYKKIEDVAKVAKIKIV